MLKRKK